MIRIENEVIKKQPKFWNHALFHPTDAIEDPWGKRILDRMAEDGAIRTIRIYSMFEDIVYIGENGDLCYDFRVSDLRLDYLLEKGYDLLIAYGGMPDCIAASNENKTSVSKNKTRYKGKMWNTSPPKDYRLWEEICYTYTKHNVERYGIETVSKWHCQCFNEPDIRNFFLSELPKEAVDVRCAEYCKLYEAFEHGIRRVSEQIPIGGPALAYRHELLGGFLDFVKENHLKLDFISLHNYGTDHKLINENVRPFSVSNNIKKQQAYLDTIRAHGFGETPIIVDEWGMASGGFRNKEECPAFMARETEVFSAYFAKLIHDLVYSEFKMEKLMICLSGQHEMTEDFSGFRNFFTLNFIKKPIYNAHLMTSKMGDYLVGAECQNEHVFVVPTKNDAGNYSVLLTYCCQHFEEELPALEETVTFAEDVSDKYIIVYCIDQSHTNPYRMWERAGKPEMTEEMLRALREEGKLKPTRIQRGSEPLTLNLTANATYLIVVADE